MALRKEHDMEPTGGAGGQTGAGVAERGEELAGSIDQTIESLSRGCTLETGDIISTGTPEGVGMGRTPQEWLQVGDILETEVEGIGILKNKVVSA